MTDCEEIVRLRLKLAEALEDGARLSDALDVTHARFLSADAQLVREGQQAAALINRLAGAVGGSPVE